MHMRVLHVHVPSCVAGKTVMIIIQYVYQCHAAWTRGHHAWGCYCQHKLTSTHKDPLGVWMEQHGRVHQALMVDILVCLCTLSLAVQ